MNSRPGHLINSQGACAANAQRRPTARCRVAAPISSDGNRAVALRHRREAHAPRHRRKARAPRHRRKARAPRHQTRQREG
jgi:hypothetical protein